MDQVDSSRLLLLCPGAEPHCPCPVLAFWKKKTLLVSGKLFQAALTMFTWKEKEGGERKNLNPCLVWSLLWSHPVWSSLLGLWSVGGWCVFSSSSVISSVQCMGKKAACHGSLWSGENRKWHTGSATEDGFSLTPCFSTESFAVFSGTRRVINDLSSFLQIFMMWALCNCF